MKSNKNRRPLLGRACLTTSLVLLSACATAFKQKTIHPEPELSKKKQSSSLTYEEATLRAKQIIRPNYTLWFRFDEVTDSYDGRTVINFEFRPKGKELAETLFIDFEDGIIRTLTVNGQVQSSPQYDGQRVSLETDELLPGSNRIEISFSHPYRQDGTGLHRFEDPIDHQVYLYSNLEPFNAHRMFPCFDQPDLKASYELTVETPAGWEVISNTQEREIIGLDERESWAFPLTPLFSTYVFALHAGPYQVWKSNANGIPLRLFARESLAKYVDADALFDITRKGLDYFSVFFGYPFPYSKYDQIIVPEFNHGGMENVAAVTLSENTIFKTKTTQDQLRRRANLILHEMAHMWFGDLVTMRWWNGLWLNESFASFLASLAVEQTTPFGGTHQSFFNGLKRSAYQEDQWVTSHPIEVAVPDSEAATAQFDAITYGKGASVLKQLNYYLGEDDFKEGIQRYFQKYALRNTSINDFMRMLAEASGKNLASWQKTWLETSGVNTLQAKWSCKETEQGNVIDQFSLLQSDEFNSPPILRPHRTRIALYSRQKNKTLLAPETLVDATYNLAQTEVDSLIGKPCPSLVFPNYEDHDYTKVILDPVSLETVRNHFGKIEDPLTRQMIWDSLWQMVVDGKLGALPFGKLVLSYASQETDTQILSGILRNLISSHAGHPSIYQFLPPQLRKEFHPQIEEFFRKNLEKAKAGSDLQLVWYRSLLGAAASDESLQFLSALLQGKAKLPGIKIDQERRWELIQSLAQRGFPGIRELIDTERRNDPTDSGIQSAIGSEVSIPDTGNKKIWLEKILQPITTPQPALSVSKLREAMWHYHLIDQEEVSSLSTDTYFETVSQFTHPSIREFAHTFTAAMYPTACSEGIIKKTTDFLENHSSLPSPTIKILKMYRQREEQCVRARILATLDFNSSTVK